MPPNVTIARIGPDDVAAVLALEQICFSDGWQEPSVRHELTIGHGRAWGAHKDGATVGYLLAWLIGDVAEIVRVGTLPALRGQGIGQALVRACVAAMRLEGARSVLLEVHAENVAAIATYRRCGFETAGLRRSYYPDGGDALVMRCALNDASAS